MKTKKNRSVLVYSNERTGLSYPDFEKRTGCEVEIRSSFITDGADTVNDEESEDGERRWRQSKSPTCSCRNAKMALQIA